MLSIVIPTLNESSRILDTIRLIREHACDSSRYEIVVIDAGSTDGTVALLEQANVRHEVKPAFKGLKYKSLNYGVSLTVGDTLLFLDADCAVPRFFDQLIVDALKRTRAVGGAFEFRSENRSFAFKLIEIINRVRYRLDGHYFGDQGLFCTKEAFEGAGGYPGEPLMEAAHFCRALRKLGKLHLIKQSLTTSSRRFEQGGPAKVFFKDTIIWLRFLAGLDVKKYAPGYWGENEKD
ncbi:MAG: glycosyltransferase [Cyclobacteriaceae bacterium]